MFERFTDDARAAVVAAQEHARTLHHDWIGTEHLLLGVLADERGRGARLLHGFDVRADWVRAEVERIVGVGEEGIDPQALATVGIDLDAVRDRVERAFGPGALGRRPRRCRRGLLGPSTPFSPRAKKALELSLREAVAVHDSEIGGQHLVLGLLHEGDGVAARILAARGVELQAARERVAGRSAA